ncbi:MAG TPA: class I SAM-dependent methyltransferase [Pseudonocardiaceae bacterium]|nr:class I SAM-dependent methyltransferase [Pseudonocardiaceae bacterium]
MATSFGNETLGSSYAENAGFWVRIIRERLDRYRLGLTDSAVLNAIGPSGSMTILDAGCGEGYLSRILAQQGAHVIAVDACAELVESARAIARESGLSIDYRTCSVDDLPIADGHCDIVVCNHLVNDLRDISAPVAEFSRVTREGGRLVMLMLHPCFYGAGAEQEAMNGFLTPDEYFRVRVVEQKFNVAGIRSPAPVRIWLRPLEDYTAALRDAGFFITSLSEPHPSTEQLTGDPWWRENFVRPLFLLIVAEKGRTQWSRHDTATAATSGAMWQGRNG